MTLEQIRYEKANEAVRENYDFDGEVVAAIDWQVYENEGRERIANVYFEDEENSERSKLGHAIVRFEPGSDEITEVYAHVDGHDIGSYTPPVSPAPGR